MFGANNKSRTGVPATNKQPAARRYSSGAANWRDPVAGFALPASTFSRPSTGCKACKAICQVFVVIIAAAAFLAGLCGERLRAKLARQAWQKRRWRRGEGVVPFKTEAAPVTDPAEQLRLVMGAGLKNAASSHGRRLRFCTPPKGQSTLRTSSGV